MVSPGDYLKCSDGIMRNILHFRASSPLKGKTEGDWQRTESRSIRSSEPTYPKNSYLDQPERKEQHSLPGNAPYRESSEKRESNRKPQSMHEWPPYENTDESAWWNKSDDRNQYSNGNDVQYPAENFRKDYLPPPSIRGMAHDNQNRREPSLNENRETPWRMERPNTNEPRKVGGNDQRLAECS